MAVFSFLILLFLFFLVFVVIVICYFRFIIWVSCWFRPQLVMSMHGSIFISYFVISSFGFCCYCYLLLSIYYMGILLVQTTAGYEHVWQYMLFIPPSQHQALFMCLQIEPVFAGEKSSIWKEIFCVREAFQQQRKTVKNLSDGFFKIYLFLPFFPLKRLRQWELNLFLLLSSSERESIYFHIHKPFQLPSAVQ